MHETGFSQDCLLIIIGDTFDEYIPGYSGFKQYNATFLILKSTYYYLKQENMNEDIKLAAIERVEKAQKENLWKYATRQMKLILIYDLRHGGAGIGGLTEERKEDAVITVLSSCRHGYEFDKIIYKLKNPEIMDRESVLIKDLLDFKQYDKFLDLQKRYRI